MNSDKKKLYIFAAVYFAVFLLVCFVQNKTTQIHALAVFSVVSAISIRYFIKKRSIYSLPKKQVALILTAFAICSVALYLISGIKFGYYKVAISYSSLWLYVIPIVAIIIGTEITRSIFIAQKNKLITTIAYAICVAIDVLVLTKVQVFSNFENFMDTLGLVILPCISANFLYHFISQKFGAIAVVPYKLILFIYPYIFAIRPQISNALLSFAKIIIPIGIYLIICLVYKTKSKVTAKTKRRFNVAFTAISTILAISFVMLISGVFQYKILVIATESMTGAIDKGDAVIYETYDEQTLKAEDVIVFNKDNALIVHRIVEINNINGEIRYYTKGDANDSVDSGYITDAQIVGIIKLKIKYMGYPSLWVRSLFT